MNRPTLKPSQRKQALRQAAPSPVPDKDAAIYRYRVYGIYRIRVFSANQSDILGAVIDLDTSQIVECSTSAWAAHCAIQQLYWMLDNSDQEYEPLGWKQPPTIDEMGLVKPAKVKQEQASLFELMGV